MSKPKIRTLAKTACYGDGWIYFAVESENKWTRGRHNGARLVKIGWCRKEIQKRLTELNVGNPRSLDCLGSVPGSQDLEKAIHEHFSKRAVRGEWFAIKVDTATELIEYIQGVQRKGDQAEKVAA